MLSTALPDLFASDFIGQFEAICLLLVLEVWGQKLEISKVERQLKRLTVLSTTLIIKYFPFLVIFRILGLIEANCKTITAVFHLLR